MSGSDVLGVLSALLLVAGLVVVPLVRSKRGGRLAQCLSNLGRIGQGVIQCAGGQRNVLPGPVAGQPGDFWWWYKEQVKPFVHAGPGETNGAAWACPDDRGYSDPRPFWQTPRFDNTSYVFNGVLVPGLPNVAGMPIAAVTEPRRTLMVMEWTAHAPLSWHRSKTGARNAPFYRDAESVAAFVDGHAAITRIYFDGYNAAYTRDPIPGYDYRFSGN